jgi:hypothetical protein
MSKFVDTTDGLINTNCIVLVRRLREPRKVGLYACEHVVQYSMNGEYCTAYTWERELAALTDEIIPGSPGYYVVRACDSEDDSDGGSVLPPEPVTAWRIKRNGASTTPILTDGASDDCSNTYGVLRPDGAVEVPADRCYASLEEFKSYVAEEARKRAKVRAA